MRTAATEDAAQFWSDRQHQQFNDAQNADAAAEERGASIAMERLTKLARCAGNQISIGSPDRQRLFLVLFITDIRRVSPDLANAIAAASGMTHWIVS